MLVALRMPMRMRLQRGAVLYRPLRFKYLKLLD
jgi:hypothetical protein